MEKKEWREEFKKWFYKEFTNDTKCYWLDFSYEEVDSFYALIELKFAEILSQELSKAREEGDIASDFLYWHPLGGGMPDSSIRIGVEFEVGGCYEDWGFVIEQNGRTISSGRTLKEAISKLKDSK